MIVEYEIPAKCYLIALVSVVQSENVSIDPSLWVTTKTMVQLFFILLIILLVSSFGLSHSFKFIVGILWNSY